MKKIKSHVEYRVMKGTEIKFVSLSYDEAMKKYKYLKRRDSEVEIVWYVLVKSA